MNLVIHILLQWKCEGKVYASYIVMLMILDNSKSQRGSFHRHNDLTQMLIRKEFLHIAQIQNMWGRDTLKIDLFNLVLDAYQI